MIIGLTGLAGCGKEEVADYLKKKYGFRVFNFSQDVLLSIAKERGIEPTKMNLSILGDELRKEKGMGALAHLLMEKIKKEKDSDRIVISGFRSTEEVDYVRNEELNFYLVKVDADPMIRFSRRRPDDPQTQEEFFARDKRDIENKGLGKVMKMADFTIKNNSSIEELYKDVDALVKKLGME